MVANSGKTLRVSAYKPVNLPEPLLVAESASGEPVVVKMSPSVPQASPPVKKGQSKPSPFEKGGLRGIFPYCHRTELDSGETQRDFSLRDNEESPYSSSLRGSGDSPKQSGEAVTSIDDRWRIDDEWWRDGPVSRLYYAVLFASGQRLVIYKDLISGKWYKQVY